VPTAAPEPVTATAQAETIVAPTAEAKPSAGKKKSSKKRKGNKKREAVSSSLP